MTPVELLKHYWGYDSFRPLQEQIIDSVLAGNDTIALLPTGGGKSLCFQIPALSLDGITLVISPLIALMRDQVNKLKQIGIEAECMTSGMSRHEISMVFTKCADDRTKLLYISPERLQNKTFIEHMRYMKISLVAVDEAHCISQWGYDFRPPYMDIYKVRYYHPNIPIIALTASATPDVVKDIAERLYLKKPKFFKDSFFRKNISYSVLNTEDKTGALLRIIKGVGGSGIVYVRNRRRAVQIASILCEKGIQAMAYHAGIEMSIRNKRQKEWLKSDSAIMIATSAFGMGIDKANVRFVVHIDIPESVEAYFQESGRAGRDNRKAYAVLIYTKNDEKNLMENLERDFPSLQYIKSVYKGVCNFYQLPVGSGMEFRHDFKIEEICQTYGFDYTKFFNSMKFLERLGLLTMHENLEPFSKIMILANREELYRYDMEHRETSNMLGIILRLYGGLFTDFTPINEKNIAMHCGMDESQVVSALTSLDRNGIVEYKRRTIHPQIVFSTPRIDINDLYICDKNYSDLRLASQKRRQSMIDYSVNSDKCRSLQLLNYFGEKRKEPCGVCDVCISKLKLDNTAIIKEKIKEALANKPLTIKELAEELATINSTEVATVVRKMLDEKKLKLDQCLRIYLVSSL